MALKDGVVLDEMKVELRKARQQLTIDSQEHLILLNKLGWTLDDYEVSIHICTAFGQITLYVSIT